MLIQIQIQILLCRNTNIYLGDLYVEQQHAHSSQPILLYLGLRVGEGFPLGYQLFFQQTIVVTNTQLKVVMNGKRSIMMPKLDFILSFIQLDTNQYYKAISDARLKGWRTNSLQILSTPMMFVIKRSKYHQHVCNIAKLGLECFVLSQSLLF